MSPALEQPDPTGAPAASLSASGMWSLSQRDRQALTRVVGAFLLTRLLLYVAGAIAIRMAPLHAGPRAEASLGKNLSLVPWAGWDAGWYLSIAERGYWFDPHGPSNVAFFPLLPLLIKRSGARSRATSSSPDSSLPTWRRWARSWLSGAGCERKQGPVAAEQAVLWLLVYPFSFFLHAIYAESLFFLLATLALDASARGRAAGGGTLGCAWPRPRVRWASC